MNINTHLIIEYEMQLATTSRIPDHLILTFTLNISKYKQIRNEGPDKCESEANSTSI